MLSIDHRPAARQRGVVLIVSLIVLVAMTLAGIALMRSVTTGNRVAGNLAFQQAATQAADVGVETAIAWLEANNTGGTLYTTTASGAPVGYFAARQDPAAGVSWETFWKDTLVATGRVNTLAADASGNTVSYVIHRMCNAVGDPNSGIGCSVAPRVVGEEGGGMGTGTVPVKLPNQQYYRITARVVGPRNTSSIVQVIVAM
ncbi:PilX N-terminal domain-containing pilus assembly protein [Piscinibacter sp. XHJ-5]|uniref:pilus assembly PilX family protein n=1 Tax=Piscinibacter sp. XHJ-5 TaxID=3037797 RepID=UPI0024529676|nr:PilX N-terminal domain-containing pilus assembly protein [Piscinibacter sp. XHJ-5]